MLSSEISFRPGRAGRVARLANNLRLLSWLLLLLSAGWLLQTGNPAATRVAAAPVLLAEQRRAGQSLIATVSSPAAPLLPPSPNALVAATPPPQATNPPAGNEQVAGSGQAQRQASDYDLRGLPSISVATIERVLAAYHSPAVGEGQGFFDLGVQYGIDPAFLLAFFTHESTAGTAGAAVANLSVGNIRCVAGYRCGGGYAAYDSWRQGAEHWYKLITASGLYCGAGSDRCTVAAIIPRYAPSVDNNNEAAYIATVEGLVAEWRAAER